MGIECAAYPFKIDVRIYTLETLEAGQGNSTKMLAKVSKVKDEPFSSDSSPMSTSFPAEVGGQSKTRSRENLPTMRHEVVLHDEDGEELHELMVLIPQDVSLNDSCLSDKETEAQAHVSEQEITGFRSPGDVIEDACFSHFLRTVSTLLIVYDNPHNANPYRLAFPTLAYDSLSLHQAMKALGALHLAHVTPSNPETNLKALALSQYSNSVASLREKLAQKPLPRLSDLATVLLLTFFEMMDSDTNNWQTRLKGAKDIFEQLFNADSGCPNHVRESKKTEAMRNFLVSALGYLDVAAAVSTKDLPRFPGITGTRLAVDGSTI